MIRRKSKQISIGNVKIGGDAPISVQSMCNTDTRNIEQTSRQIKELADAGCELVRLAVLNKDAAEAIKGLVKISPVPLIADIHFDYRLAIQCINNGISALRLNPGNIGKRENVEKVVNLAKQQNIPIRIGVNAGSLEKELQEENIPLSEKMVKSALKHIRILEDLDFDLLKTIFVVAIAGSIITTAMIQKIKEMLTNKKYLGIVSLIVSMFVGTLFAMCFSNLSIVNCLWCGSVCWLGADMIYKTFEDKIFTKFSDMNKDTIVGEIIKEVKDE